ncbi:hypothetical protein ARMGADRAFT_1085964 [Armillaria gallica]|uniref:F-box domain-containing protein n=1 Tax=Armillaria gallica TaxID=47427 RepID=A0A2H3D8P0_ARMGA|nr:hypothetical protein ARMGADRAFT_1085964 [Armillaria gallica]
MPSSHSASGDLPPELFEEILSHLDIPTIKVLSLASSNFHTVCFPHLFRSLSLNGDLCPAPEFPSNFQGHKPIPCLRKADCPVSLLSLRATSLPHPKNHDLGEFIRKTSLLLDLSIEAEHRPVSLPLRRLKSLSMIDRTNLPGVFADFFTTPSESDDISLESLSLSFSCNNWLMPQQIFRHFSTALSQQPRFRHLKTLHLTMMRPFSAVNIMEMFDSWVGRFELDLKAGEEVQG